MIDGQPEDTPLDIHGPVVDLDTVVVLLSDLLSSTLAQALRNSSLWHSLQAVDAHQIVVALKDAADRYWGIDPRQSMTFAETIIAIGNARSDIGICALGTMAKGDALKFIGSQHKAWDLLEKAGDLFQSIRDEVGWARTWIGRLRMAVELNKIDEALAQAKNAKAIFERYGEQLRLLRLHMGMAQLYGALDDHTAALNQYQQALLTAATLDTDVSGHEMCGIYNNMAITELEQGNLRQALTLFERASEIANNLHEEASVAICQRNIAVVLSRRGRYRDALRLMAENETIIAALLPLESSIQNDRIECLLALNRFEEARDIGSRALLELRELGAKVGEARTSLQLATALAQLDNFKDASSAAEHAERIFQEIGARQLVALARLRQSQIALRQNNPTVALEHTRTSKPQFVAHSQMPYLVEALLVELQALVQLNRHAEISAIRSAISEAAYASADAPVWIQVHVTLGQIAEAQGFREQAFRRYQAAAARIERLQQELTITLRPSFMSDKLEPVRRIFRMQLDSGRTADAFDTTERVRALIAFGYLANRGALKWSTNDLHSTRLADELNELREKHRDLYARAFSMVEDKEQHRKHNQRQLAETERRMKELIEQLYLRSSRQLVTPSAARLTLPEIHYKLGDDSMLTYFIDGEHIHAFVLCKGSVTHQLLSAQLGDIDRILSQLERNVSRTLSIADPKLHLQLRKIALTLLQRLYQFLLAPIQLLLPTNGRVHIVPTGALHMLPFNALFDGNTFLINRYELVILPSASMLGRVAEKVNAGAVVMVDDWEGRLTNAYTEGAAVAQHFQIEQHTPASKSALQGSARQILHIVAHGEYRLDQPDFSFIQLHDGQLFMDDILQLDLAYELVTLSGCETGRGRTAVHDDAFGLSWAFLYAGCNSVLASLWRVDDIKTSELMQYIYTALAINATKSEALRIAQLQLIANHPDLHPAFWAAFQLAGNPGALLKIHES